MCPDLDTSSKRSEEQEAVDGYLVCKRPTLGRLLQLNPERPKPLDSFTEHRMATQIAVKHTLGQLGTWFQEF